MNHGLLMNPIFDVKMRVKTMSVFFLQSIQDQVVSDSNNDAVIRNNSDYEEDMAKKLKKYV